MNSITLFWIIKQHKQQTQIDRKRIVSLHMISLLLKPTTLLKVLMVQFHTVHISTVYSTISNERMNDIITQHEFIAIIKIIQIERKEMDKKECFYSTIIQYI